jgi:hypothetical protein
LLVVVAADSVDVVAVDSVGVVAVLVVVVVLFVDVGVGVVVVVVFFDLVVFWLRYDVVEHYGSIVFDLEAY